jgi:hypothetical protein
MKREQSRFERRRRAELKQRRALRERVIRRMINRDEEAYQPPAPKRPQLKIVK